jgi:hypothetical protein
MVKFWDDPLSSIPVVIDTLTAYTYADAAIEAVVRVGTLRARYGNRIGYKIEGPAGELLLSISGKPHA